MREAVILVLFFFLLQACTTGNQNRENAESNKFTENLEEKPEIDFSIEPGERIGAITVHSTEGQLRIAYGSKQFISQNIIIGEGEESPGAILFPDTKNELELIWNPTFYPPRPSFARISRDSTQWKTIEGVSIGTTLEDLERINGKKFFFYGFEWDYAGLVASWNDGNLNEYLIVALIPGNFEAVTPDFMGEVKFASNDPKLKPLKLKVGSMVIGFKKE